MIVVIGNIKGGVGKTTIAVNIAIARAIVGMDVLLVDGDEQGSATIFNQIRNRDKELDNVKYTFSGLIGADVCTEVSKQKKKYDDIIIDVGGRNTASLRASLIVADKIIVPVQPRSVDIWPIAEVVKLIDEANSTREAMEINKIKSYSFLNQADSQGKDNDEAEEYLRDFKTIELLPVRIGRRKAFPNAASNGKSVLEHLPKDEKASRELQDLINVVYS